MMVRKLLAVLYTGLCFGANGALAEDMTALLTGDMAKLTLTEPQTVPVVALSTMNGDEAGLATLQGKWVVVNFWATWCAPCRAEMPTLDRLQADMPEIVVMPVATGRNSDEAINQFWEKAGIANLVSLRDPQSALSRQMGIAGLPVTVIVNPEGQEVGRLIGDADWDSPEALAVLRALMAGG